MSKAVEAGSREQSRFPNSEGDSDLRPETTSKSARSRSTQLANSPSDDSFTGTTTYMPGHSVWLLKLGVRNVRFSVDCHQGGVGEEENCHQGTRRIKEQDGQEQEISKMIPESCC